MQRLSSQFVLNQASTGIPWRGQHAVFLPRPPFHNTQSSMRSLLSEILQSIHLLLFHTYRFHLPSERERGEMDNGDKMRRKYGRFKGRATVCPCLLFQGRRWPLPLSIAQCVALTSPLTLPPPSTPSNRGGQKLLNIHFHSESSQRRRGLAFLKIHVERQIARGWFQIDARRRKIR